MSSRPETVVYCGLSLDGFIARPDGAIDWLGAPPEGEDYGWSEFIATIDALVMGRKTFELLLTFPEWHYGATQLFVLSRTLRELPARAEGRAELTALGPAELLAELGRRGKRRVYVDGGLTVQSFLAADLIDELILTRLPVLIGQGIPLFGPLGGDLWWDHQATRTFRDGLVRSRYRRRGR
jgi:dihydrofolate reductase